MNDLSNRSCCVVDAGQFFEVATRMTREFGEVYFHNPELTDSYPKASKWGIGQGFDGVQWIEELWPHISKIDYFIFPDIGNSGLQLELERQGKKVIGSRLGDRLEQQRILFKQVQERLGLLSPVYHIFHGLRELADHLKTAGRCFVKLSKFRGSHETTEHFDWSTSEPWMNSLAVEFGPLAQEIYFTVEEPINHKLELGYDGFCFDGNLPPFTIFGPEIKNKSYAGAWTKLTDLDDRLLDITSKIADELGKYGYKNFYSNEIIIAEGDENFKDGDAICIEPTCRSPHPPFSSECEIYDNLGEMLAQATEGNVITPEPANNYVVECRLTHDGESKEWRSLSISPEHRNFIKLCDPCKIGDTYHIIPKYPFDKSIGAVVGLGDTLESAIEDCHKHLESLKYQPVSSEFESLTKALIEIKVAEKDESIDFGKEPVPEPEIILENQ